MGRNMIRQYVQYVIHIVVVENSWPWWLWMCK